MPPKPRAITRKFGFSDKKPLDYREVDEMLTRTLRTFKPVIDNRGREVENNIFAATIRVSPIESMRLNPALPHRDALMQFGTLDKEADDAIICAIENNENRECRLFTKEYA